MPSRFYDEEFSPEVLQMVRKRDILGRSNHAQFSLLVYDIATEVVRMEHRFDAERKQNPLLETTPPEAWLTTEIMAPIAAIRSNAAIRETVLVAALKRYFRSAAPVIANKTLGEQQLWTTVRPYRAAFKRLLGDLYDRRKSLCGILRTPAAACTVREAISERKPNSAREEIILLGIRERWPNQRIVAELDRRRMKPRTHKSYAEKLRLHPQQFYALKSHVKRKYLAVSHLK